MAVFRLRQDARYLPDERLLIIVLHNSNGPLASPVLADDITDLMLGPVAGPVAVPYAGDMDALVGEYAGSTRGGHQHVIVTRDGDRLVMRTVGTQGEVRPIHIGIGIRADGAARIRFVSVNGRAVELVTSGGSHYVYRRVR